MSFSISSRTSRLTSTAPVTASWPAWDSSVHLAVLDAPVLNGRLNDRLDRVDLADVADRARAIVRRELAAVDKAASLRRPDAELHRLYRAAGSPFTVSPLLAELVAVALATAAGSGGDVDPTVGNAVLALEHARFTRRATGSGRSATCASLRAVRPRAAAGWQAVRLEGRALQVPAGVSLDLTATAGAFAADRCARLVAQALGVGVLVAVGRDVATAGPAPDGGWAVDLDGRLDGARIVHLPAGHALSTSRPWTHGNGHGGASPYRPVVDPRTGREVEPAWRAVSVVAGTAVEAGALALATVVRGPAGLPRLAATGVPARLVTPAGDVVGTVSWPHEDRAVAS